MNIARLVPLSVFLNPRFENIKEHTFYFEAVIKRCHVLLIKFD